MWTLPTKSPPLWDLNAPNAVYARAHTQSICVLDLSPGVGLLRVAGSILRPLSQSHIFKRVFMKGHISRFFSVFQVIQDLVGKVFLCGRSWHQLQLRKERILPDFETLLLEKRPWKPFFTNVLIRGEMDPLHKHKIMSVGYQVKQNLKSRSWTHF